MAKEQYGDMVKAVADIEKGVIVIGGELHSDANILLTEEGSDQTKVWGFNVYPDKLKEEWLEFNSLINIKPTEGNFDMEIQSQEIIDRIKKIVSNLIQ